RAGRLERQTRRLAVVPADRRAAGRAAACTGDLGATARRRHRPGLDRRVAARRPAPAQRPAERVAHRLLFGGEARRERRDAAERARLTAAALTGSSTHARLIGVIVAPGPTPLTRMPSIAYSSASVLVRFIIPPLLTL